MAELTAFDFRPGTTLLHRFDPRFKMLCLMMISLTMLSAGFLSLLLLSAFLTALMLLGRAPVGRAFWELRYFLLLLLLVFLARGLSTPGTALIEIRWPAVTVTRQGLLDGALVCWRLVLIVVAGFLLVATTRSSQIKAAVEQLLRPIPWIPHQKVAIMIGLLLRFIPVILNQAHETAMAQRARGVENRKNPLHRLPTFAIALIRRIFLDADHLSFAMESRCFGYQRSTPTLAATSWDWTALVMISSLCLLVILFDRG
jgi:energy-coupling factor transporter transmembrane protein EcfT